MFNAPMLTARRSLVALVTLALLSGAAIARDANSGKDKDDEKERSELPRGSKAVIELAGEGRYKLTAKGHVWLVDPKDDNKILASATLGEGDTYAFNAKEDHVYINGKEVEGKIKLEDDKLYRIYFYPTEKAASTEKEKPAKGSGRIVPDTAKVVEEGRDKELSYVAKADGTAYLYDSSHDQLIETFNLSTGDRLTISPKSNAMAVNGKTISRDTELDRKNTYKLLFDVKK